MAALNGEMAELEAFFLLKLIVCLIMSLDNEGNWFDILVKSPRVALPKIFF